MLQPGSFVIEFTDPISVAVVNYPKKAFTVLTWGEGMGWAAVSVPQNRGPLLPHRLYRVSMDAETKPSRAEARSRGSTLSKPKGKQLFDLLDEHSSGGKDDARTWAEIPKAKRTDGGTAALSSYNQSPSQICFGTPASTQFLPIC
ncbi:hypothetical protein MCOR23_009058 [Pyricularia oryzae]|nr:hypothetical protein MCOR23_009058 [Pyricularia oryzae]KAI6505426.1 hypothetical protein MCOR13_004224 [Pyricularia oryzae]